MGYTDLTYTKIIQTALMTALMQFMSFREEDAVAVKSDKIGAALVVSYRGTVPVEDVTQKIIDMRDEWEDYKDMIRITSGQKNKKYPDRIVFQSTDPLIITRFFELLRKEVEHEKQYADMYLPNKVGHGPG